MNIGDESISRLPACLALVLLTALAPAVASPKPIQVALSTTAGGPTLTWSDPYILVQHRIPGNSAEPWGVATGPNGDVWFVEQGTNQLGMFDPVTGRFVQYKIPTTGSTPSSVAVDGAGDVWFTELTANKLAELPAGGTIIDEIPVPHSEVNLAGIPQKLDCGPGPVIPDPRGYIWVGCLFSNQLNEFFPRNGSFARFDLPVFNSAPAGLVLDGKGNLWFTAADAQMLGKASLAGLKNGTTDGITESPPLNQTYVATYDHATSFLGTSSKVTSSLPTPSGIAVDGSGRLWITEHVDTSFDSYDPGTSSLVKYWTSQTFGAYGYSVSFPNGIAVDGAGNIWIGEHYGNKILDLNPSTGLMTEYPVPCCRSVVAGVYSVAMDRNGTLWFVEIDGSSIGEMVRTTSPFVLSLKLPQTNLLIGQDASVRFPLNYTLPAGEPATDLNLSVSGVSFSGALSNISATFAPARIVVSPEGVSRSQLTLQTSGLKPGVYYLTLSAATGSGGDIYSAVLKLTVTGGSPIPIEYVALAVLLLTGVSIAVAWRLTRMQKARPRRR